MEDSWTPSFDNLPEELKRAIARKLDPASLASIMLVNRELQGMARALLPTQQEAWRIITSEKRKVTYADDHVIHRIWEMVRQLDMQYLSAEHRMPAFAFRVGALGTVVRQAYATHKDDIPESVWRAIHVKFDNFKHVAGIRDLGECDWSGPPPPGVD